MLVYSRAFGQTRARTEQHDRPVGACIRFSHRATFSSGNHCTGEMDEVSQL